MKIDIQTPSDLVGLSVAKLTLSSVENVHVLFEVPCPPPKKKTKDGGKDKCCNLKKKGIFATIARC